MWWIKQTQDFQTGDFCLKLKVALTYFVMSAFSHMTRRYRNPRVSSESHELLVCDVNINHFLTMTKCSCCLNRTSCENGSILTRRLWSIQK